MNLLLVDDEAFALEALEHAINWKSLGIDQVFTCQSCQTNLSGIGYPDHDL